MRKIHSEKGETIVETLVSMLLLSICFITLAGAVVASARVNRAAKELHSTTYSRQEIPWDNLEVYLDGVLIEGITGYKVETDYGDEYYYETSSTVNTETEISDLCEK